MLGGEGGAGEFRQMIEEKVREVGFWGCLGGAMKGVAGIG